MIDVPHVEVSVDAPGKIDVWIPYRLKDEIQKVPGAKWDTKRSMWTVPLAWTSCVVLRGVFGVELIIGDNLVNWAINIKTSKHDPILRLRELLDIEGLDLSPETAAVSDRLFPHQVVDVEWLLANPTGLLFNEQRTGKTPSTIRSLAARVLRGDDPFPALVVCPNRVKPHWKDKFVEWWPKTVGPPPIVTVIDGTPAQRRKQLQTPSDCFVINWEALRIHSRLAGYGSLSLKKCTLHGGVDPKVTETKCEVCPRELNAMNFRTVIADEAHRMKDPESAQNRALRYITKDAPFRVPLTGTPQSKNIAESWAILHWADPVEWPSRREFISRWAQVEYNFFGGVEIKGVKPGMEDEWHSLMNLHRRRVNYEDVSQLMPERMYETHYVDMSPKQKKSYTEMKEQMVANLDGTLAIASSPLIQAGRLSQLASSSATAKIVPAPTPEDPHATKTIVSLCEPSNKIDAFMDDLKDWTDDNVVAFCVSRQLADLLAKRLEKAGYSYGMVVGGMSMELSKSYIDAFQAGDLKVLVCTTQAGGAGLTLTKARVLAFLQCPWSLIDYLQAKMRNSGPGSEEHESLLIVNYVTRGTIEVPQIESLKEQNDWLDQVLSDKRRWRDMLD